MSESDFSAITEVVPQISYDIIGRIIPGSTVIVILIIAFIGPSQALLVFDEIVIHPDAPLSGWAIVLFLMITYILAMVLDGIWQIPACLRRLHEKPYKPDLENPSPSFKVDLVSQKLPKAGAWLTKLYAETNLTRVLIIGFFIGAVINLYELITIFSLERLWFEVALVVGIIGTIAVGNSISTTRENSLKNYWVLIQRE